MHHLFAKLLLAADLLSYAQASTLTARAVEPTATGEIGVNPPDDLGDSTHYIGWIGVDTSYLSLDGSTTKVGFRIYVDLLESKIPISTSGLELIRNT